MRIGGRVAEGVQMDWEAILRPSPAGFAEAVSGWLHSALEAFVLEEQWPKVAEVIDTPRKAVQALALVGGLGPA
jgi:hypothetical protein